MNPGIEMDKLIFFHQQRRDGRVRTGIELNDDLILEEFSQTQEPADSALLWFVDVRCIGSNLPSRPENARAWFLDRSSLIQEALNDLARELGAGIDSQWPLKKELPSIGPNRIAIYCSAVHRLTGLEISKVLADLGRNFQEIVRSLGHCEPVEANG